MICLNCTNCFAELWIRLDPENKDYVVVSSATKKRVEEDDGQVKIQALFGLFFVITQFPSLITHYSSLITRNTTPVWHHHSISITKYFSHFLWVPYLSLIAGFFFFFFLNPNSPNLVKKKKKDREKPRTDQSGKKKKETQNRPKTKKQNQNKSK